MFLLTWCFRCTLGKRKGNEREEEYKVNSQEEQKNQIKQTGQIKSNQIKIKKRDRHVYDLE
jgi:hypothetical protein